MSYKAHFSSSDQERTLILLKPDSIQRGLIGRIIQRFEDKGFKLIGMKFISVNETISFFPRAIDIDWLIFFFTGPERFNGKTL